MTPQLHAPSFEAWQILTLFGLGFLGGLIAAIGTALGWLADKAATIAAAVAAAFVKVALLVKAAAVWLWTHLKTWSIAIGRGIRQLWSQHIQPFMVKVFGAIKEGLEHARRFFKPVFDALDKIRKILSDVWTKVLQPIIKVLEVARTVLRVLAKLGLDWAKDLEAFLAKIEQTIIQRFSQIVNVVNTVSSWLEALFEPWGILKQGPLLWSIWSWREGFFYVFFKSQTPFPDTITRQLADLPYGPSSPQQVDDRWALLIRHPTPDLLMAQERLRLLLRL